MSRNIELKARYADLSGGCAAARSLGATLATVERQRDTYFRVSSGRLKLRERWRLAESPDDVSPDWSQAAEPLSSQLIFYDRRDATTPRPSNYSLVNLPPGAEVHDLLGQALSVVAVVVKHRTVYLYENVRIHLDHVRGLGCFLEFEAIVDETHDEELARAVLDKLLFVFNPHPDKVLAGSYADMM